MNKTQIVKILTGIAVGFGVSQILITVMFTSSSGVSPQSLSFIQKRVRSNLISLRDMFKKSPDTRTKEERLATIAKLKAESPVYLSPGMYEGESRDSSTAYTYYEVDNIQWEISEIALENGEVVRVRYPVGQTPPSAELFQD